MNSVDFITFCCPKDIERLCAPGELARRVESHRHDFNNIIVVRQRCHDQFPDLFPSVAGKDVIVVDSEAYPTILGDFGIESNNEKADEMTHGPTALHYWKWHVINHLIGLKNAMSDYIVFSDADCRIKESPNSPSWIEVGIQLLYEFRENVLIVAPSDGGTMAEVQMDVPGIGHVRCTQNVSQQLFLINRRQMLAINFDLPWDWEYTAPGGPFQEYYYMLEGRLWRYMHVTDKYRAILPDTWRYWHDQW